MEDGLDKKGDNKDFEEKLAEQLFADEVNAKVQVRVGSERSVRCSVFECVSGGKRGCEEKLAEQLFADEVNTKVQVRAGSGCVYMECASGSSAMQPPLDNRAAASVELGGELVSFMPSTPAVVVLSSKGGRCLRLHGSSAVCSDLVENRSFRPSSVLTHWRIGQCVGGSSVICCAEASCSCGMRHGAQPVTADAWDNRSTRGCRWLSQTTAICVVGRRSSAKELSSGATAATHSF
jgi:hypothetical protein